MLHAVWDENPVDVSQEVNFIWSIANILRGAYREEQYKDVIIPMTIIRRLECALEPQKGAVLEEVAKMPDVAPKRLCKLSKMQFYNTSPFTLAKLTDDSEHLADNFKSYLDGFSENVRSIVNGLRFRGQIDQLNGSKRLLSVVRSFAALDLDPRTIDNIKMGYIFEDLIRRFSENGSAGDHYTGRDIIRLMVALLLAEGCNEIFKEGKIVKILDQACGTGGMLFTAAAAINRYNPDASIRLYGQDVNPEAYAICLAEMLIKGTRADGIRLQNTFTADCFEGIDMDFVIENPPFGTPWGGKEAEEGSEEAVREEAKKAGSRWPAGIPAAGDSQMLFLQSGLSKLSDTGRMAIIHNSSPLFVGGPESGESKIRRWILENDWLEAIVALPTDLFYNTGIASYIWILSRNKSERRRGKVQLIDAAGFCTKLRKALGSKRNEFSPDDRKKITELYAAFEENEYSRIFRNEDFMYRVFTVMQPLQRNYAITEERIRRMQDGGALASIYDEDKIAALEALEKPAAKDLKKLEALKFGKPQYDAILERLYARVSDEVWKEPEGFATQLVDVMAGLNVDRKMLDRIAAGLSEMDKTAPIQKDRKGHVLYDKETKNFERIPLLEDVDGYMAREVLPFVPDAIVQEEKDGGDAPPIAAEIPFTRYFFKYKEPISTETLKEHFLKLEASVQTKIAELFTVTKGLNSDVEMKDSGMSWAETIPKDWNIRRLKHLASISKGLSITKADLVESGIPVVSYGQIHSKANKGTTLPDELVRFVPERFATFHSSKAKTGSFIFADTSENLDGVGNFVLVDRTAPVFAGYHSNVVSMTSCGASPKYLAYLFLSDAWRRQLRENAIGTKVYSITQQMLKDAKILLPPLAEQQAIANHLDAECARIDAVISDKQEQIAALEEYRKSLIHNAVTGKMEVPAS